MNYRKPNRRAARAERTIETGTLVHRREIVRPSRRKLNKREREL